MSVAEYNGRVSKSRKEKEPIRIYQEHETEPIEITQSLESCANCWNNRRCIYVDTINDVKETCIFYDPIEINEEPEYKEEGVINDYCSECSKERICKNARGSMVIKECGARTKNYNKENKNEFKPKSTKSNISKK